jgi:linoleoyl-CoA desaturase
VEATAKEFGYTYNLKPTFLGALYSHIHRLKELGYPTKQHIVTKQTVTIG